MTLLDDLRTLVGEWEQTATQDDMRGAGVRKTDVEELRAVIARHSCPLDDKQLDTLIRLASGDTITDLKQHLSLSYGGVTYRTHRIYTLYGVSTATEAVIKALRAGHIIIEDIKGHWAGEEPTAEQKRVLQAVADHGTNEAVAEALGLGLGTVKMTLHKTSWRAGTGCKVQMVVRAYREGWVK